MSETTTEQLAEIEGQATEYTPPEGWRVLQVGELLQPGDQVVQLHDGKRFPTERVGQYVCETQRYIRPIEPQSEPVQVREGRWRTRNGLAKDVTAMPTDHEDFAAAYPWWDGVSTWRDDGRWLAGGSTMDLVEYLGPIEPDKTQELETKTEELPDKTQELPEYTPPEGWRVLAVGEVLRDGDLWVNHEGELWPTKRVGERVNDERYIRRIESQAEPVQVREGRWRTRSGEVKNIRSCEPLKGAYYVWPWTDGFMTFQDNGLHQGSKETPNDLVEYLGPIEPKAEPAVQNGLVRDFTHQLEESGVLDLAKAEQRIEELRSEVSYVQNLLGTERQRVTQLEELVGSLRTINEAQEKAFNAANKANDDLQHRLNVVAAEWAEQAETIRRLQIELDAAQQVPADSPELRQLRADLEQVTQERDKYRHAHELLVKDADTVHERTKAATVEAIAEWLEPVRLVDNPNLANETLQHLPQIMRHLTGLAQD